MILIRVYLFLLIGFLLNSCGECFFSYFSSVRKGLVSVACSWIECCDKQWNDDDFRDLERSLKYHVYGQDIAIEIVLAALKGHLRQSNPRSKALTLSFHGRPGIGKNYVSSFLKSHLFSLGTKSKYSLFFTARVHFPEASLVWQYKREVKAKIQEVVSACEYALVIFDEVDKMPPGLLDAIKPFIDYHDEIDGVDYRRAIFVFLSNTAGDDIGERYLQLWEDGKKRKDLRVEDFEDIIRLRAFNEKGGFLYSETIESNLIDYYVPFLPLEEGHVKSCIKYEFSKRYVSPSPEDVNEILKHVTFGPEHRPILVDAGCKRLSQKVFTHIERIRMRNDRKEL